MSMITCARKSEDERRTKQTAQNLAHPITHKHGGKVTALQVLEESREDQLQQHVEEMLVGVATLQRVEDLQSSGSGDGG
jgi:hypothetical protein